MPSTGQICIRSGIYSGKCSNHHVKEITLSLGERFPPCHSPTCKGPMKYRLVRPAR
jgi:hypothetical protein